MGCNDVHRSKKRMVEIRTFEGNSQELSDFVSTIWQATYQDRMPIPVWTSRFFDWQIAWLPAEKRMYCVAAYDGTRLAGAILGEEFSFRWLGETVRGSQGSWLTVDPEYRGQRVAAKMVEELKRRHQRREAQFQIGYGYQGSSFSLGPKFWKKNPVDTVTPTRLGFWVRVLDPAAVADWELNRWEGIAARSLKWIQSSPDKWKIDTTVRKYRSEDLDACHQLVSRLSDRSDVSLIWERSRLEHHLAGLDFPRTLVCEIDGEVKGFVNYHVLDYCGRGTISVALIDLMAFGKLSHDCCSILLKGALQAMQRDGVDLAMVLRTPCFPARPLLSAGFIPRLADQAVLLTKMASGFHPGKPQRFHMLWR